jgi:hypothetical protein
MYCFLEAEQSWQACEFMSGSSKETEYTFVAKIYTNRKIHTCTVTVLNFVSPLYIHIIRLPLSSSVLATVSGANQLGDILSRNTGLWSCLQFTDIFSVPAVSYLGRNGVGND